RYRAMHEYFARIGPDGARMMRLCCAIQVNLDAGSPAQVPCRWRLANLMAPVLAGMFAHSPFAAGGRSNWKSARGAVWRGVDPSRTGVVTGEPGPPSYLSFALNAGVLLRRGPAGYAAGTPGVSFGDWLEKGGEPRPTLDDWHYHLTTLFPQVRPRGYLELRCFDALPVRWRAVPVAVASGLLIDDATCQAAIELLEPYCSDLDALGLTAARGGLDDPEVAHLARALMRLARDSFPRMPDGWLSTDVVACVEAFDERYTARGRCPSDDALDQSGGWEPW